MNTAIKPYFFTALTTLISLPSFAEQPISSINFVDDNFQSCVSATAAENNWQYTSDITQLNCQFKFIKEVPELSYFSELKELDLSGNNLESLNLSANKKLTKAQLSYTKLSRYNFTHNPELKTLYLSGNNINQINLRSNKKLETLSLFYNPNLYSLDLNANTALKSLTLSYCNFTYLSLYNNTELSTLELGNNNLNILDINRLTKLQVLRVSDNSLSSLSLDNNKELQFLNIKNNSLTTTALNYLEDIKNSSDLILFK